MIDSQMGHARAGGFLTEQEAAEIIQNHRMLKRQAQWNAHLRDELYRDACRVALDYRLNDQIASLGDLIDEGIAFTEHLRQGASDASSRVGRLVDAGCAVAERYTAYVAITALKVLYLFLILVVGLTTSRPLFNLAWAVLRRKHEIGHVTLCLVICVLVHAVMVMFGLEQLLEKVLMQ